VVPLLGGLLHDVVEQDGVLQLQLLLLWNGKRNGRREEQQQQQNTCRHGSWK
jgi:hypothetical protein